MAWLQLTAPNGDPVHVSADQLVRVRSAVDGAATPGAKAMVDLANGQSQATLETPDEVMALIGGKSTPLKQTARRQR
jgi:hypothetical protein